MRKSKSYGYTNCIDCGAIIKAKDKRTKRCSDCKKKRAKEYQKEYSKTRYKTFIAKPEPKKKQKKYTPSKTDLNKVSLCKKTKSCIYGGRISGMAICDYLSITGHSRGCPIEGCTKYIKKGRKKREPKVHREDDNL